MSGFQHEAMSKNTRKKRPDMGHLHQEFDANLPEESMQALREAALKGDSIALDRFVNSISLERIDRLLDSKELNANRAEISMVALREFAFDKGDSEALERFVKLSASQVDVLNWWIEGLSGWSDWPFPMRPNSKNVRFNEIANKIQLAAEPIQPLPSKPDSLAHRWLRYAFLRFAVKWAYEDGSAEIVALPLSDVTHGEWLKLLVEFTMKSTLPDALELVGNAKSSAKARGADNAVSAIRNAIRGTLSGPLRHYINNEERAEGP